MKLNIKQSIQDCSLKFQIFSYILFLKFILLKNLFKDALRKFIEKLEMAKEKWEDTATMIQTRNKQTLMELQMTDPWTFDEVKPMRALHF